MIFVNNSTHLALNCHIPSKFSKFILKVFKKFVEYNKTIFIVLHEDNAYAMKEVLKDLDSKMQLPASLHNLFISRHSLFFDS